MDKCKKLFSYKHTWSKWRELERYTLRDRFSDNVSGKQIVMQRECEECGFVDIMSKQFDI